MALRKEVAEGSKTLVLSRFGHAARYRLESCPLIHLQRMASVSATSAAGFDEDRTEGPRPGGLHPDLQADTRWRRPLRVAAPLLRIECAMPAIIGSEGTSFDRKAAGGSRLSVRAWHAQVEKNEEGHRISFPVCVRPLAAQIANRLLSIANCLYGISQPSFFEGPLKDHHVVLVIFDEKNVSVV